MHAAPLAIRISVAAACIFASWRSIRMAASEYFEYRNTQEGHRIALELDPGNEFFIARNAELKANFGDPSPDVDEELKRAVQLNPLDSSALMALGLREEDRRDRAAVGYLERAAELDHTYKPAWTLLNYYFRAGDYDRAWPVARRCLDLIQPRNANSHPYDPAPVFDILWRMTDDPARIFSVIPNRAATLLPYLAWLSSTNRADAALQVWPVAFRAADLSSRFDTAALASFCDFLISSNRALDATAVWNALVSRGVVKGTRLDPAASVSVEDPTFEYPPARIGFDWFLTPEPGEFAVIAWHNLRIEFTGDQPETSRLFLKSFPVLPDRKYRIVWRADASRVESSSESAGGLYFRIVDPAGQAAQDCPPVVSNRSCEFEVKRGSTAERLDLIYSRPLGATRMKGTVLLSRVEAELEPGS